MTAPSDEDLRRFVEEIKDYGRKRRASLFDSTKVRHHEGSLAEALRHWQAESAHIGIGSDTVLEAAPFIGEGYGALSELSKSKAAQARQAYKESVNTQLAGWRGKYLNTVNSTAPDPHRLWEALEAALKICDYYNVDDRGLRAWYDHQ